MCIRVWELEIPLDETACPAHSLPLKDLDERCLEVTEWGTQLAVRFVVFPEAYPMLLNKYRDWANEFKYPIVEERRHSQGWASTIDTPLAGLMIWCAEIAGDSILAMSGSEHGSAGAF